MANEGPLVVRCATDPQVETALRCGRCDTPICPRCLIMTPVGARCRNCARLRGNPIYQVGPLYYLKATAAGLAVALVCGFIVPFIPFLSLFGLMVLGWLTGSAVSAASNYKRGTGLAVVAAVTTVVGAVGAPAILAAASLPVFFPLDARLAAAVGTAVTHLFSISGLFVLLAVVVAVSRVR
jgi:hypothetical protein